MTTEETEKMASALLLGTLEGLRNRAWREKNFSECYRINSALIATLEEVGSGWDLFPIALKIALEWDKKLQQLTT